MIFLTTIDIGAKLFPDFWTMVTQLGSTFVLFLILRKFLYQPVVNWLEKRAALVQDELDGASAKKEEATLLLTQAKQQRLDAVQEAQQIISDSKQEAQKIKEDLIKEANQQIATMKAQADQQLALERKEMQQQLSDEVVNLALQASQKLLSQQATSQQQQQLVEQFVDELRH